MLLRKFSLIIVALLLFCSAASQASVVLATRLVYPADQKSVSLDLTNMDKRPSLVQVWIDPGDPNLSPEKTSAPFVVTPPVSRIDGGKGQTLRITYTGEPLASDRESIFYINVLDIPPKPKAEQAAANYLQIALRSRIKLFFRPTNLDLTPQQAYQKVQWALEQKGDKTFVRVDNPTPYYLTYQDIILEQGKNQIAALNADMVAPYSKMILPLAKSPQGLKGKIKWTVINDQGGRQTGNADLP